MARTSENTFQINDGSQQDRNLSQSNTAINVAGVNVYQFLDEAYNGSGGFRDGNYLIPYPREMSYQNRKKLAYYKNYVKPILRAMVEPVFAQTAIRTVTDQSGNPIENLFTAFIENCDIANTNLQDYVHGALNVCRRHGVTFIVMDNFQEQPDNLKVAIENDIHPYVYLKKANEVDDYECDRFGNLEWIIFEDGFVTINNEKVRQYRKWTKDASILMTKKDGKYTLVSSYEHGLGQVPVIVAMADIQEDHNNLLVDPPLYDIARNNYVIYNMSTELRDLERSCAFPQLYAQGMPDGALERGTSNCLNVPMGATITPGYATPGFEIFSGLVANQDQIRKDIYTIAEQLGVIAVLNSESGIAKSYDFFAHENTLKRTASIATYIEYKMVELFKLYTVDDFVYTVIYKTDYSPTGLDREIDRIDKILKITDLNKTLAGKLQEKLANLVLVDEDVTVVQEVIQSIKKDSEETVVEEEPSDSEVTDANKEMSD
jgi:hypothetical protein